MNSLNKTKKHNPLCVGVIMDGNRRWAKERGLSTARGHEAGYETLKNIVRWAKTEGVGTLIAYAFSTENWNRSSLEVNLLMKLFERALTEIRNDARAEHTRVSFIGDRTRFSKAIQKKMEVIEHETEDGSVIHLVLAMSYGGRAEIARAAETLAASGKKKITEEDVAAHLWTGAPTVPDPDLIIRTGGEMRLSNFLLWQAAYSELFFTKTFWPDLSEEEFKEILREYAHRERRRGK